MDAFEFLEGAPQRLSHCGGGGRVIDQFTLKVVIGRPEPWPPWSPMPVKLPA